MVRSQATRIQVPIFPLILSLCGCVDLSRPRVLCVDPACPDGGTAVTGETGGPSGTDADGQSHDAGEQPPDTDEQGPDTGGPSPDTGGPFPDVAKLEPGLACNSGDQCLSGVCADGVCCTSACPGTCRSCNVPGAAGTCSNVAEGQDPKDQCPTEGPGTCGTDGACDGSGSCRLHVAGTVCAPSGCSGATESSARTCNGRGMCNAAVTRDCAPYLCAGAACGTTCTINTQCRSPNACVDGACGLRGNGAVCTVSDQCISGICAQGTCCATVCTGVCTSCGLAGTAGTCTSVPAGTDPTSSCVDEGTESCGQDGTCNGSGGCRAYPFATFCSAACGGAPRGCVAGVCRDGAGNLSCGKFQCGGSSCRTTCASDSECASPNVCRNGACGGLRGEYFDNIDFTNLRLTRTDAVVDFTFPADNRPGVGSPSTMIGADSFSVRWTGTIKPPAGGSFTFFTLSDDRVRLLLDHVLIIDNWAPHTLVENSATVTLVGSRSYQIELEWGQDLLSSQISLLWAAPAVGIARQIIPTSVLAPAR